MKEHFVNGAVVFFNYIAELLWKNKGIAVNVLQIPDKERADSDLIIFTVLLVIVFLILIYGLLQLGNIWLLLFVRALFPVICIWMKYPTGVFWGTLYGIGTLLNLLYLTNLRFSMLMKEGIFYIVLILCMVFCWNYSGLKSKYTVPVFVTELRTQIIDKTEQLRYKNNTVNSLPNGKISTAGNWKTSEKTALKVTMENPQSMYLKGFVGTEYKDGTWQAADKNITFEKKDLFYWLHQDGFFGTMQLSKLQKLLKKNGKNVSQKIRVENVNGNSRYYYVPYEMNCLPGEVKEIASEDTLYTTGLYGDREYSFETDQNLVKDFTALAAEGYLWMEEHPDAAYRKNESYYNAYVYETATEISDSLKRYFEQILGTSGNRENGHMDYASAIFHIRKYLEEELVYTEYPEKSENGSDVIRAFLEDTKEGYSIHYASAAAMMFRYYGIPSRYVEGYMITPEDVENIQGNVIELSGKRGHAWTEIYIDGTGWVPVEMTPEYYGVMEEADLKIGLEAAGIKAVSEPKQEQEQQKEETEILKNLLNMVLSGFGAAILLLVEIFDVFFLVFLLWVYGKRFGSNLNRRRKFLIRDNKKAVGYLVRDAERLYRNNENYFSDETKAVFENAYKIGEKAVFSPHDIQDQERVQVQNSRKLLLKEIKRKRGVYDKWVMKYIKGLY